MYYYDVHSAIKIRFGEPPILADVKVISFVLSWTLKDNGHGWNPFALTNIETNLKNQKAKPIKGTEA